MVFSSREYQHQQTTYLSDSPDPIGFLMLLTVYSRTSAIGLLEIVLLFDGLVDTSKVEPAFGRLLI